MPRDEVLPFSDDRDARLGRLGISPDSAMFQELQERRIRKELSTVPGIQDKLKELWEITDMVKAKSGGIDQEGYTELNLRFQKALNPPTSKEEALEGTHSHSARSQKPLYTYLLKYLSGPFTCYVFVLALWD